MRTTPSCIMANMLVDLAAFSVTSTRSCATELASSAASDDSMNVSQSCLHAARPTASSQACPRLMATAACDFNVDLPPSRAHGTLQRTVPAGSPVATAGPLPGPWIGVGTAPREDLLV